MIEFMRQTDTTLYDIFVLLGGLFVYICNFCFVKKFRSSPGRVAQKITSTVKTKNEKFPIETILACVEIFLLTTIFYTFGGAYNIWFGKLLNMQANYFGMVLIGPLAVTLLCLILGIDVIKAYDNIAVSYPFGLIFAKFACFCAGCCHGIEWENGLYNYYIERYEFPIQLVEMGWAVLIFIILLVIRKKAKPGTMYPIYLFLYSSIRFCTEFLRHEENILGPLKLYHLLCILGVVISVALYLIAIFHADKFSAFTTWQSPVFEKLKKIPGDVGYEYQKLKRKDKKKKEIVHHKKRR